MSSIFDSLSAKDAKTVRAAGREVRLPAGWSPIQEKTPPDKAYIVLEGSMSVRRGGQEIATLGPGEVIGEAAIVNRSLRSASVVAATPVRLLHFTDEALRDLADRVPAFGEALRSAASRRLGSGTEG